MDEVKCLDTYALMEIYQGNEKFLGYFNSNFVVNDLTLSEFYGVLLKVYGAEQAELWYSKLENYSVPVDKRIIMDAVKFRYEYRKQDISFFDAVGYIFSLKNGYKFATGDKEFKGLKGVEYKKK